MIDVPGARGRGHGILSSRTVRYSLAGFLVGLALTVCGYLLDYYHLYRRLPPHLTVGLLQGLHAITPVHYFTDLFPALFSVIGALLGRLQERAVIRSEELETVVRQRTKELRRSESRYSLATTGTDDGIWEWDPETGHVYYSPRWMATAGLPEREYEGTMAEWLDRVHPDDRMRLQERFDAHVEGFAPRVSGTYRLRHVDGMYRWMRVRGLAERDDNGQVVRVAGSQRDIHEEHILEEQLRYLALYDEQTDLPNHTLFRERVGNALGRASARGREMAVLYLGVDRLRKVQEALGREAGESAVRVVGKKIWSAVRRYQDDGRTSGAGDTLARLQGDEFGVVLYECRSVHGAVRLARYILGEFERPIDLGGQEARLSVSVGIVLGPDGHDSAERLIQDAHAAMSRAKAGGGGRYELFDAAITGVAQEQLGLEADLAHAMEEGQLQLWYQPIFKLRGPQLSGFEALLRWQHPRRGMILPGSFIRLAEETGLITPISRWVVRQCFQVIRSWMGAFPGHVGARLNVNISPRYMSTANVLQDLARCREETGAEPGWLNLEVTESALIDDPERAAATLQELRDVGFTIALDDFGTGYSSLSMLHDLPIDTLKIDRAFIARVDGEEAARTTVAAIIGLARTLGQKIVAEGIETEEQLRRLRGLHCTYGQGFLLGKPMPLRHAEVLLQRSTARRAAVQQV